MACSDLMGWPSGILKLFHVIFNLLTVVSLFWGSSLTAAFGNFTLQWQIEMCILLIGCLVVMISFIFVDGSKWRLGLLVYYAVGFSLTFDCMLHGGFLLDSSREASNKGFYWTWIFALIFTICSFVTYVWSALVNGINGYP